MPIPFTRRDALASAAAFLALPTLPALAAAEQNLRDVCRQRDIRHGTARDHLVVPPHPELDRLIAAECDIIVPENGGKWVILEPQEGVFDWGRFDAAVQLAERIGARPVWHCALWQTMGMPDYMKLPAARQKELGVAEKAYFAPAGTLSPENHWKRFTDFAAAVRNRYGDRFYRIDVINEPFYWETAASHPQEQDALGFRKGQWWDVAGGANGPEWLDPFFRHLNEAFPSAILVLNEFGIEIDEGWHQRKRAYLAAWLKGAKRRGVPIHGVGLQSHLYAGKPYDRAGVTTFLGLLRDLDLPVHVTELDVEETFLPGSWSRERRDAAIARIAGDYLTDLARSGRLREVTWWGLRSDLNYIAARFPDQKPHPSPYDEAGRRLPLYQAAAEAIARAPTRG